MFLTSYFDRVWPPFLVYLAVYLLGWMVRIPVPILTVTFQVMHGLHAVMLLKEGSHWIREKNLSRFDLVFWSGILLLFLLPGAFLEYASDPWEHYRRIFSWQTPAFVDQSEVRDRFAYFWNWSWVATTPVVWRRFAMAFVSAFWQWAVCVQFARLLSAFGFDRLTQKIGVVSWICFFGTGLYGIRYYALSSTPLAMIALYAGLECCQRALNGKRLEWLWLPCLILLMELNHPKQELAGFLLGGVALVSAWWWNGLDGRAKRHWAFGLLALLGVGMVAGILFKVTGIYRSFALQPLSFLGSVSFRQGVRIGSTLGVHGILGTLSAVYLFRRYPAFSAFSLAPVFILFFPPTCFLLMVLAGQDGSIYRVLYAAPTSVAFGICLYKWLSAVRRQHAFAITILAVMAVGLVYKKPVYGRLFFQLYRNHPLHALVPQDQTAAWFDQNRKAYLQREKCRILADDATYFSLAANLGLPLFGLGKLVPNKDIVTLSQVAYPLENFAETKKCGVLMARRAEVPLFEETLLIRETKHWGLNVVSIRELIPESFDGLRAKLLEGGWKSVPVPPYYDLWEPPGARN